jgi:hypothetical protein
MFSDTGLDGAVASVLGGAAFAELDDPGAPHAESNGADAAPAASELSRVRRDMAVLRTDIGVSFA